ncbi:hypothetical protein [Chitinophaga sp. Ak27]|uniref:hypothetical protein n=1 Tax=Chitinophaga sp. Ak27 TaxID=2726116 RepID=UPI00145F0FCA|nr:hypothetical protein [Chitinophaga sp. Ak27]NLU90761.1 hypothetical protein [Chitinophaga sp. Ak27]
MSLPDKDNENAEKYGGEVIFAMIEIGIETLSPFIYAIYPQGKSRKRRILSLSVLY